MIEYACFSTFFKRNQVGLTFYADLIGVTLVSLNASTDGPVPDCLAFSIDSTRASEAWVLALLLYACKGGGVTVSVKDAFRSGC